MLQNCTFQTSTPRIGLICSSCCLPALCLARRVSFHIRPGPAIRVPDMLIFQPSTMCTLTVYIYTYIYIYVCIYILYSVYVSISDIIYNRRKFRSQTSDNMDRWKAEQGRGREKRKIRRKKSRRERVRRKKMQMREKVGKSRNTVFFQWFVAPEGRKVGSLKRRVRS